MDEEELEALESIYDGLIVISIDEIQVYNSFVFLHGG